MSARANFPKRSINSVVLARAIHQVLEKYALDQELERTEQVVFTLAAAVEAKDPTTGEHLRHMMEYSVQLSQALDLGAHELTVLRYGAILHDIGKVGRQRGDPLQAGTAGRRRVGRVAPAPRLSASASAGRCGSQAR